MSRYDSPFIGILMATYNGERYIAEQIHSILNQDYTNWLLLIHDDCSTDNTLNILKMYANKYPKQIVLIDDGIRCGGSKENFAYLLKIAKKHFDFDYVMFSDQDDYWLEYKISKTLKKMYKVEEKFGKSEPILIHSNLKVVDQKLSVIHHSFWEFQNLDPRKKDFNFLLVQNNITGCTIMINKSLLMKIHIIPKNAIMHDWWIALVASAFGKIDYVDDATILYRQHQFNDTGAKKWDFNHIICKIFDQSSLVNSIRKTIYQAEDFKDVYFNSLDKRLQNLLMNFLILENVPFIKRLLLVFKFNFRKHPFLRQLGFLYGLYKI